MTAVSEVRSDRHPWLFPEPLGGHGHRRGVVGDFVEELTARLIGGRRHKTQGDRYCPDISAAGMYFECKGMGRSKQTFIYEGRLHKDRRFVDEGNQLFYVVWHHLAETSSSETVEELRSLLLKNMQWVAIIPFDRIEQVCLWQKPTPLNSKYGRSGSDKLYGSGYRIPARYMEEFIVAEWEYGA